MIEISTDDGYGVKFSVMSLRLKDSPAFAIKLEVPKGQEPYVDADFLKEVKEVIDLVLESDSA